MSIPATIDGQLQGVTVDELMVAINACGDDIIRLRRNSFKTYLRWPTDYRLGCQNDGSIFNSVILGRRFRFKYRYKVNGEYRRRNYYFSGNGWLVTMCSNIARNTPVRPYEAYPHQTIVFSKRIHGDSGERLIYNICLYGSVEMFHKDMLLVKLACEHIVLRRRWR